MVAPHTCTWATACSPHRLTTANANGCRACSSWPTGAASWKRRSNLDFGSVLFSVKAFFGLPVTPYSFTPYYLLFSIKAFFGLPVTPYSFTPYYLLFIVKAFLGLPVTPYSFTPYYLLFRVKTYLGLPVGYAPNLISLYGVL